MILNNKTANHKIQKMKKSLLLIAAFITGSVMSAQINKTISIGAGYVNENYYALESETEYVVTRDNWDLAFASNGVGFGSSAIRINGAIGCELYFYEDGIAGWNAVNTAGFNFETARRVTPDNTWLVGAFGNAEQVDFSDLGWGTYNTITHIVTGDRIFVMLLADGTYRKLIIESLNGSVYSFKYANIDGSDEVSATIAKTDYPADNFGYYSIQNNEAVDREPDTNTWDLLFTKYVTDLGDETYYGVSGVFSNVNVKVAQTNGVADVNSEPYIGQDFSFNIGTIGYDWKSFNNTTFSYDVTEDLVYFVQTENFDVYRVIFTGFGGGANGDFVFSQELVGSTVDIEENLELSNILSVYPNPAIDRVNLTFIGSDQQTRIVLTDMTGKQLYVKQIMNAQGMQQEFIDVNAYSKGVYFLSLITGNKVSTQKVIVE